MGPKKKIENLLGRVEILYKDHWNKHFRIKYRNKQYLDLYELNFRFYKGRPHWNQLMNLFKFLPSTSFDEMQFYFLQKSFSTT